MQKAKSFARRIWNFDVWLYVCSVVSCNYSFYLLHSVHLTRERMPRRILVHFKVEAASSSVEYCFILIKKKLYDEMSLNVGKKLFSSIAVQLETCSMLKHWLTCYHNKHAYLFNYSNFCGELLHYSHPLP